MMIDGDDDDNDDHDEDDLHFEIYFSYKKDSHMHHDSMWHGSCYISLFSVPIDVMNGLAWLAIKT